MPQTLPYFADLGQQEAFTDLSIMPCHSYEQSSRFFLSFLSYLAVVLPLQVRPATLNLIPHALHVMQVVGLVTVLGEHGCSLLSLLYLPSPELPFSCLAIDKPADMLQCQLSVALRGCYFYNDCSLCCLPYLPRPNLQVLHTGVLCLFTLAAVFAACPICPAQNCH